MLPSGPLSNFTASSLLVAVNNLIGTPSISKLFIASFETASTSGSSSTSKTGHSVWNMPVSSAVRIEVDDRRPKKHAAAFVGRLRPPIALAASPALFARRLYNRRDPRLQAEGVPAICSLQRAGRRLPTPGARFCRRPRTALTRTPEGRADADARGPRSRRRPRAALTRTRTSRRPGRARVVFRHTALFQLSTAAKYGARRSSIALSTCRPAERWLSG